MNKKGQIFSLDFLISLVAVTLAIGLLIQFSELKTYNEKEEMRWMELKMVAETAADLIAGSSEISCELVENSNVTPNDPDDDILVSHLNNCIVAGNAAHVPPGQWDKRNKPGWWRAPGQLGQWRKYAKPLLKEILGIPEGYKCLFMAESSAPGFATDYIILTSCLDDPSGESNVYAIKRNVAVYDGINYRTITKEEFENCVDDDPATDCHLVEATIELQVWKE